MRISVATVGLNHHPTPVSVAFKDLNDGGVVERTLTEVRTGGQIGIEAFEVNVSDPITVLKARKRTGFQNCSNCSAGLGRYGRSRGIGSARDGHSQVSELLELLGGFGLQAHALGLIQMKLTGTAFG